MTPTWSFIAKAHLLGVDNIWVYLPAARSCAAGPLLLYCPAFEYVMAELYARTI